MPFMYTVHVMSYHSFSNLVTAKPRSAIKMSISSFVVSLPTLSLIALMATSSGMPEAVNTDEGLLPAWEWQAAPTLA